MKKKMLIFFGVIVVLITALIFVVSYQNNQKLEDNPYGKEELRQSTIDQIDNPMYQNQILPGELEEKLDNNEDVTVYFYSPECVHCQKTTPVIVPMTKEYDIDMKKLNILEFEKPWQTYNIEGTPTVIHFENGEEAARISGENSVSTWDSFFQENVLDEE
ncbi:thioredoxin family protein [Sediminibacillus albus]|uniref:Thioredoxin n=1 Tax=Sediminibacillus albus TaxID=407036 RepID=A0A1G8XDF6_9BACI|nr:thioredoxin family protein [Sediminibacillus albus]SDJ88436.1 Thioredoxin [Sediminibacillus albus]